MKVEATITGKRQITIPKELYDEMGLKNTDKLVFSKNDKGEIVVTKKEVNKFDICPICERNVTLNDIMVVEESQKYHLSCWDIELNKENKPNYIANKLTKGQIKTIKKIGKIKKESELDMIRYLEDDEVIIDMPMKIRFMESKDGVIGMISPFDSNKLFSCNEDIDL